MVEIKCETEGGGACKIGDVTISHKVVQVADLPVSDITYVWFPLKDGRTLSLFFNRDSGLFAADIANEKETGGNEFVRVNVNNIKTPK